MSEWPSISVIVASHGRPGWLARCLTSLRQLDYPSFEIVVAADSPALKRLTGHPARRFVKTVAVDQTNIAIARNAGLAQAAGEIVAFIDDDAVAEPLWLRHFALAFRRFQIAAAVGFVRGRNGISYQSAVTSVDREGETHQEPPGDGNAFIPRLKAGRAVKLVGTNFAVRRDALASVGGFDPAFRYYHDDTDLSLRLTSAGHKSAAVPLAQVHHAFAPSTRRTRLRAPRDLTDIGRSTAIFALRYRGAPPDELKDRLFRNERARLVAHMVRGTCEPGDIAERLATLAAGWREGAVMDPPLPDPIRLDHTQFKRVPPLPAGHAVFSCRPWDRSTILSAAIAHVELGGRASVFNFSPGMWRHQVRFVRPGIWLQSGGVFGRSVRSRARYRWCTFAKRVEEEIRRVALPRGIGDIGASFVEVGENPQKRAEVSQDRAKNSANQADEDTSEQRNTESDQGGFPCGRAGDAVSAGDQGRPERDHDAGRQAAHSICH